MMGEMSDKVFKGIGEEIQHKAILELLNFSYDKYKAYVDAGTGKTKSFAADVSSVTNTAKSKLLGLFDTAPDEETGLLSTVAGAAKEKTGYDSRGLKDGVIAAKYNPNMITFCASAKDRIEESKSAGAKNSVVSSCAVSFSTELIFENSEISTDTVSDYINIFLYIMQTNQCRWARFSWANISIEGMISDIRCEYGMFNAAGEPILGKAAITIQCQQDYRIESKDYKKVDKTRKDKVDDSLSDREGEGSA